MSVIPGEMENSDKPAAMPAIQTNGHHARENGATQAPREGSGYAERSERGGYDRSDRPKAGAMEVTVDHNIEKAMKILKRKLIKEGLFKELKSRRYYEKPSERRKRKHKESVKKLRKEESRAKKNSLLAS